MEMERVTGPCPLGAKCEDAKDGKLHVCPWFVGIVATSMVDGQSVTDTKMMCTMSWIPKLLIDAGAKLDGIQAATESFRNEMVKDQQGLNTMLSEIMNFAAGKSRQVNNAEHKPAQLTEGG